MSWVQLLPSLLYISPGGIRAFSVSVSLWAVSGSAGQGSPLFSFLGSLGKEQASGFFLPVTPPALCVALLVLSPGGLEEVGPSMSSGGVELPKQNFVALFQKEVENSFDFSYRAKFGFESQPIC